MATSDSEICNIALFRLGISDTIASLDDDTTTARVCKAVYNQCLNEFLRVCMWPWAIKRVVLSPTGTPPDEWGFSYAYPADCVRILDVVIPGNRNPQNEMRIPYRVEYNGTQRVIYTDAETATIRYTSNALPVTEMPSDCVSALAWKIAGEVAMPLRVKPDYAQQAKQAYVTDLSIAAASSASEAQRDPEPMPSLLSDRGATYDPFDRSGRW